MAFINIKTTTKVIPQCYAYTLPGVIDNDGWTKIGFTERDVETRVKEQTHTAGVTPKICWHMRAAYMTEPYGTFTDKNFHSYLKKLGVSRRPDTEWFSIEPSEAKSDFIDFTQNHGIISDNEADPVIPYSLRDEQNMAVDNTVNYFKDHENGEFLWNAKPRFGKTLSAYDLCKRLDAKNILIVTNRPAIANSWYADYERFFGAESGWVFISNVDGIKNRKYVHSNDEYLQIVRTGDENKIKGCIEFVSLQDLKGSVYFGGEYDKLVELSDAKDSKGNDRGRLWDILIIDEAHEGVDTYKSDVAFDHVRRKYTLHLSGTPFKQLANDKFPEKAIYNWTYADEQKKKRDWDVSSEQENPYANLPQLCLYTYQMSDIIREKVSKGIELADNDVKEYAFNLNDFFETNESGKFVHENDVDKFLDALTKQDKFPFSTPELRAELKHTFWLLNRVASAKALAKKLRVHPVFKDYYIVPAFGDGKIDDDEEVKTKKSFDKVTDAIKQHDKTITLSVGQLTTGVTIPEWTAVLMLSNMSSPALYMQAAFRAQNPCLFSDEQGNSYRKKNAYVFDFDPARTLNIYEQFANDLCPSTSGNKGDLDEKKNHVRELLNFFPVYGEDSEGSMIMLDAESVLTIPRRIHAREVVDRGFMSNFLFANISGIFGAPREIIDVINNMQSIKEKDVKLVGIDENTHDALSLDDNNNVKIPESKIIGTAAELFGDNVYGEITDQLSYAMDAIAEEHKNNPNPKKDEFKQLKQALSIPITESLVKTATDQYGTELKKSTVNQLESKIQAATDKIANNEFGNYKILDNQLNLEKNTKVKEAQNSGASMSVITSINDDYEKRRAENYDQMIQNIKERLHSEETVKNVAKTIVDTVETERLNKEKDTIESGVRDHLRGFSRTIPAFLMAYGNESTTLSNFDSLVPENVFWEVTVNPHTGEGVSVEQFRMLRDGGDYYQKDEDGNEIRDEEHKKHFDGHLFDEVVFNDAVAEFMRRRKDLADYFNENDKGDIFDYIPPQKTNQIFTPKKVVKDMVDRLEKENPGCFDDDTNTFADLYMKSGMYITEIVKRLYNSPRLKTLYPNDVKRLNHIFAEQVYGLAPTEIIYRICLAYILGFSDEISIDKHNIRLCDTLEYAKNGTLEEKLAELFPKLANKEES